MVAVSSAYALYSQGEKKIHQVTAATHAYPTDQIEKHERQYHESSHGAVLTELQNVLWDCVVPSYPTLSAARQVTFSEPHIGEYTSDRIVVASKNSVVRACRKRQSTPSSSAILLSAGTIKNYAIKTIGRDALKGRKMVASLDKEVQALATFQHPNIVKFIELLRSEQHLHIVMEDGGKDLFELIALEPQHGLRESVIRSAAKQLLAGLHYMHRLGFCHRDLKTENVLLNAQGQLKIVDVGLCEKCGVEGLETLMTGFTGSFGFFAPEVLTHRNSFYNGCLADIFSFGAVLLEMLVGTNVFQQRWAVVYDHNLIVQSPPTTFLRALDHARVQFGTEMKTAIRTFSDRYSQQFIQEIGSLISRCCSMNATHRPTTSQIMFTCPWISTPSVVEELRQKAENYTVESAQSSPKNRGYMSGSSIYVSSQNKAQIDLAVRSSLLSVNSSQRNDKGSRSLSSRSWPSPNPRTQDAPGSSGTSSSLMRSLNKSVLGSLKFSMGKNRVSPKRPVSDTGASQQHFKFRSDPVQGRSLGTSAVTMDAKIIAQARNDAISLFSAEELNQLQ